MRLKLLLTIFVFTGLLFGENMEIKRAVFLDRDGTINRDCPNGYTHKVEDFVFEEGAVEGLSLIKQMGFLLIVVTNQSGIGRGYYTEEQYHVFNTHMLAQCTELGIEIDAVYYCPHHPSSSNGEVCNCRKPEIGMAEQALSDFAKRGIQIDLSKSYMVGDKTSDGLFGNRIGATSILVNCASGKQGKAGGHVCEWDYEAEDLADAARWIFDVEASDKTVVRVKEQ